MKRKLFAYSLALALLLALLPAAHAAAPEPDTVVLSPQSLTVDGEKKDVQKYNIDGSNYFKLRDLAYLLSGTGSQFSVGWDAETNTVSITTGEPYVPGGGELALGADKSASTVPSAQIIRIDGKVSDSLTVYNIGGENYFKLRELGAALRFGVDFDAATNTAAVRTVSAPDTPTPEEKPEEKSEEKPEETPEETPAQKPSGEASKEARLTIVDTEYALGMTEAELISLAGTPDEKLPATGGYEWYVYGTDTYRAFFLAGVYKGKVVALASAGDAFSYLGYEAGRSADSYVKNGYAVLCTDKNDADIVHAVLLRDKSSLPDQADLSDAALRGESMVNFHLTNAFRVFHACRPLLWSESAAEAARLHSDDMAKQDYFAHNSLDGRTPPARMEAQGIRWSKWGENIVAGYDNGFGCYDAWVNSSVHRDNMLGGCAELGVGFACRQGNTYRFYMTQDFFTARNW